MVFGIWGCRNGFISHHQLQSDAKSENVILKLYSKFIVCKLCSNCFKVPSFLMILFGDFFLKAVQDMYLHTCIYHIHNIDKCIPVIYYYKR